MEAGTFMPVNIYIYIYIIYFIYLSGGGGGVYIYIYVCLFTHTHKNTQKNLHTLLTPPLLLLWRWFVYFLGYNTGTP